MKTGVIFTDHSNENFNRFLNDIRKFKPLTKSEEYELILAAQEGDKKAEQKLIEHNLAYVVTIAKQLQTSYVDIEDLINVGWMGLAEAIYHIDLNRGNRLITMATPYIRRRMYKHLLEDKSVYIPENEVKDIKKGISEMYTECRLDDYDEDSDYYNIPISRREMPDYQLEIDSEMSRVNAYLDCIKPKKASIFRMLHGLDDKFDHAPEAISEIYGCTRERIRQIDKEVMAGLRHHLGVDLVA